MKKNIFISWSSSDKCTKDIAEGYKNLLNVIFEDKIEIFFSEEMEPAKNSAKNIHSGLEQADIGIVLVSKRTTMSPWLLYEFGCMHKLLQEESLYLILLDLDAEQLSEIAPPMENIQTLFLDKKEDNIRLIESIAKKLGISGSELLNIEGKAGKKYDNFNACVKKARNEHINLPDKYAGVVFYNDTIMDSNNFQMPQIFECYTKNILLVGMSLGKLFNIKSDSRSMDTLIKSLIGQQKTVNILISNLWDEQIFYTFNKMIFGFGGEAYAYLNEVFFDDASPYYLDTYIKNFCSKLAPEENEKNKKYPQELYEALKKQLLIKRIDLLMDTFWFIDNDETTKEGSMLLAPLTARTGAERPVFYATRKKNEKLYSSYFGACKSGFDAMSSILWPIRK